MGKMGRVQTEDPWHTLYIDFLGTYGQGLPESASENRHLLMVICGFTRYPIGIPLQSKELEEVVNGLMEPWT